ncbi:MAG TPA: DUF983 domain-containing protein [Bacteroidia bacterium]|nr:DUF983 domain-containing protein [Bacteroidia bacterium]
MKKGSKLYSILNNKCPRCQEGSFFIYENAYNLKTFTKMHKSCPVCGQNYEPEPGYYYGAMYVSYALNVAILVAVWVATAVLFEDMGSWWFVFWAGLAGITLAPLTFRLARLTWINFFVKYRKSTVEAAAK